MSLLVLLCSTGVSAEERSASDGGEAVGAVVWKRSILDRCRGGIAVQRGDVDLGVVAERAFGDRNKWGEILTANPGLNPSHLEVGQCLLIRPAPSPQRLLAIMLGLFVRTTMDLPAPEEPENMVVVPDFAPSFQSALADCIALVVGTSVDADLAADAELTCAERLATAWRLAMSEPQRTSH